MRRCLRADQPGPYQIQAAINAVHSDARARPPPIGGRSSSSTISFCAFAPSPVVALHRAVAVAEVDGPEAALGLVERLDLKGHHLFHAVRADLLRRSDRWADAALAYDEAVRLTDNAVERDFLRRRRRTLGMGRAR